MRDGLKLVNAANRLVEYATVAGPASFLVAMGYDLTLASFAVTTGIFLCGLHYLLVRCQIDPARI